MMSLLLLLAYLVVGGMRETICVLYYKAVSTKRPLRASGLAGGIELYDLLVLSTIVKSNWDLSLMLAYTVGVVIGTYLATRWSK